MIGRPRNVYIARVINDEMASPAYVSSAGRDSVKFKRPACMVLRSCMPIDIILLSDLAVRVQYECTVQRYQDDSRYRVRLCIQSNPGA